MIPEDWDFCCLDLIAKLSSGTTPSRSQEDRYYRNGKYHWVKTTDLNNSHIITTEETVTQEALDETCLQVYPPGTVFVAMYGGFNQIGRTGLLKISAAVNQALIAIQPKENKLNSAYLLANLNYRVEHWKSVASSSRKDPNITSQDVKDFTLPLPDIEEQRAIATALSDVDALIAALDKLIAKQRHLKTATMQQLLTGKQRLPGFGEGKGYKQTEIGVIPEDWEVRELEEITDVDPENLGSTTHPEYEFKYISLEDVTCGVLNNYSEQIFSSSPSRARRVLQKGDVLLSTVRPNLKSHLIFQEEGTDWVCSTGFAVLRCKEGLSISEFLFPHLFSDNIDRQIETLIAGSNYPAINSGDVKSLEIPVPPVEEQRAIATVLSDMDAAIAALEARRAKTQAIKQGMMQELLTGRTRLV